MEGGGHALVGARRSWRPRGGSREKNIELEHGSQRESNHSIISGGLCCRYLTKALLVWTLNYGGGANLRDETIGIPIPLDGPCATNIKTCRRCMYTPSQCHRERGKTFFDRDRENAPKLLF